MTFPVISLAAISNASMKNLGLEEVITLSNKSQGLNDFHITYSYALLFVTRFSSKILINEIFGIFEIL